VLYRQQITYLQKKKKFIDNALFGYYSFSYLFQPKKAVQVAIFQTGYIHHPLIQKFSEMY